MKWLLWRVPILSVVGGIVYIGYGIYDERHPEPQIEADPTKKTLVILGTVSDMCCCHALFGILT